MKTQDAVAAFSEYIDRKHRKPGQNYDYFLREFNIHFADRNMAEITPAEVEGFLYVKWGGKSGATWNQCKGRASSLFSFCIKELKRKGSPSFHNPCGLVDDVPVGKKERKEFVRIDKMKQLLDTFTLPHHWLMFHILATSGIRIEELTCLRPIDVTGRVLRLATYKNEAGREVGPKSKRFEEYAVIPQIVADKLKTYMQGMPGDKPIFKYAHATIREVLETHAKSIQMGKVLPHDLRRWVATYWERQRDYGMVRFVLRHSSVKDEGGNVIISPLTGLYVAPFSAAEACQAMDGALVEELFNAKEA